MSNKDEKEKYMRRCIQLAANGRTTVAPNPMVGAVVVCDGRIIGEGYHVRYGQAHAEVNAIQSVQDQLLLQRSTLYVNLEPCSHYGHTPPCADLIISKQIPCVVVGCVDVDERVAGRGIRRMRDAGIEVEVGVLADECNELNIAFNTFHLERRPFIILKWAQSADGYLDRVRREGAASRLSSSLTKMLVHKLRAEVDAILVGSRTAQLDNPALTIRHWYGKNPLRIVLDRQQRLPDDLQLFDGTTPTLRHAGTLAELMTELYRRNITTLLVEGGAQVLQSFYDAGLWDEIVVEHTQVRLGDGVKAPEFTQGIPEEIEQHFGNSHVYYKRRINRSN